MADLFDYLEWRGDIPFDNLEINDIDLLVASRLAYLPFDSVEDKLPLPLCTVLEEVLSHGHKTKERYYRTEEDEALAKAVLDSPRFAQMQVFDYVNTFDAEKQEQFSAISFFTPSSDMIIAFRGTDGTLVGWKEDFNMAFSDEVASQADSVRYLKKIASAKPICPIYLCGHSKGGNLAVYSAAFSTALIKTRIRAVRNFDGPGFSDTVLAKKGFLQMLPKIKTILPNSSVVGMLLEHDEEFTVIESKSMGAFQHNLYLWQVRRGDFLEVEHLTNSSRFIDSALKLWLKEMDEEKREKLINGVYEILSASEGRHLRELFAAKNIFAVLRAAGDADEETGRLVGEAVRILSRAMKQSAESFFEKSEETQVIFKPKKPQQKATFADFFTGE